MSEHKIVGLLVVGSLSVINEGIIGALMRANATGTSIADVARHVKWAYSTDISSLRGFDRSIPWSHGGLSEYEFDRVKTNLGDGTGRPCRPLSAIFDAAVTEALRVAVAPATCNRLLCVGGPLDGQRVLLASGMDTMVAHNIPGTSYEELRGVEEVKAIAELVVYRRQTLHSTQVMALQTLTAHEILERLVEGYNPAKN